MSDDIDRQLVAAIAQHIANGTDDYNSPEYRSLVSRCGAAEAKAIASLCAAQEAQAGEAVLELIRRPEQYGFGPDQTISEVTRNMSASDQEQFRQFLIEHLPVWVATGGARIKPEADLTTLQGILEGCEFQIG
jgi:hypothetical protein